jgi:solute carrier family 25 protein 33/36
VRLSNGELTDRAINFYFYPTSKVYLAKQFPNAPTEKDGQTSLDSPVIHLSAAVIAGIMTATGTNPIWGGSFSYHIFSVLADSLVVKTRLQLSARKIDKLTVAPSSVLPGPIASSAAALSGSTNAVKPPTINPLNAVGTAVSIIKQEGIRGLYRGMSASYLGVSEGVIQWVLYEVSLLASMSRYFN